MTDALTRCKRFGLLLAKVVPVPAEWLSGTTASAATADGGTGMTCLPCASYATVVNAWRKAVKWFPGADHTLSVMLASAFSTEFVGEQLWFKIIGPPSSLKTTLLEGLAVASDYVFSKDSLRGFHDGWKDEDGEDRSLIALARGKTLAIKDGDTLLKAPDLPRILSEARGLYDRVSRTHYRNHKIVDYVGHRMTFLLCGTSALREIDDSELGSRMLDSVIMDRIEDEFEDEVSLRSVYQESSNMLSLSDGKPESQHPADLVDAMRLTGGYVCWLRENALGVSKEIKMRDDFLHEMASLGKFTAIMRATPPKRDVSLLSDREFAPRLSKQFVRLGRSQTAVLNKWDADEEVYRRCQKVCLDTSRGKTLDVVRVLHEKEFRHAGATIGQLAIRVGQTEDRLRTFLRFLAHHQIVDKITKHVGTHTQTRFALTKRIRELYEKVINAQA